MWGAFTRSACCNSVVLIWRLNIILHNWRFAACWRVELERRCSGICTFDAEKDFCGIFCGAPLPQNGAWINDGDWHLAPSSLFPHAKKSKSCHIDQLGWSWMLLWERLRYNDPPNSNPNRNINLGKPTEAHYLYLPPEAAGRAATLCFFTQQKEYVKKHLESTLSYCLSHWKQLTRNSM